MTDYSHQFIVVHPIHQPAEHPDAAIPAGKGIDVFGEINLEIQVQPFDPDSLGKPLQTYGISRRIGRQSILCVHPGYRLSGQTGDLYIGQSNGSHDILAGFQQFTAVQGTPAYFNLRRSRQTKDEKKDPERKKLIHISQNHPE